MAANKRPQTSQMKKPSPQVSSSSHKQGQSIDLTSTKAYTANNKLNLSIKKGSNGNNSMTGGSQTPMN